MGEFDTASRSTSVPSPETVFCFLLVRGWLSVIIRLFYFLCLISNRLTFVSRHFSETEAPFYLHADGTKHAIIKTSITHKLGRQAVEGKSKIK